MALKDTVKQWFKTKLKPTQVQFYSFFDAIRWKDEKVATSDVDGLDNLLIAKADKIPFDVHLADTNKHVTAEEKATWNETYSLSPISGSNKVDLLRNGVSVSQIDLTPYLDDSNLARLTSGVVDANGLATFTRDDNSTFTVDLSNLKDTQQQADFNQTDNTKPDFIKGFPLSVLDSNGAEKFKTKEIQFDENFDFNPAENEVQFKSEKYIQLVSKITSTITNTINSASITTDKEYVRDLPDGLLYKVSRVFLEIVNTIEVIWQNNNIASGHASPEFLEFEIGIRLIDCSINWMPNNSDMVLFKQRMNQSEIPNIIQSLGYLHTFNNTVFRESQLVSSNPTDKIGFSSKTMNYLGNITDNVSVNSFLKNLANTTYKKYDSQTETKLYIKSKVKFMDDTNSNGLNASWSFKTKILDFKLKK
ncbi:hypothetical protein [Tenacibaculum haliotis]|uniref:hypothetical protein n=1 Tax=Tenacibaculum haliotis TaxID=1888914 RepID=UPI0021AEF9C8|nr:hypothetical protein [Tenacibaculum haliotis]MCT4698093.1 hypothetical protein [Tenacibaculum haliotis]